ncbi:hypothetical protein KTQ42_23055 [Noviherbaspirillum sp. L7-7A]|uniref:hypothetical protein n=1 Tax=Noviherbaspirillum sp. L7-7A TaxID=2850560 RepID=UPI001C2B961E|nr:hypothetical protein [Noviherbaspirillum sp. L7-7A]MBV0882159.1 hypothetical protein [Noviherbaspirillum sp. L7-7A]
MARYIKQYDPNETHRRIGIEVQEERCPGLLEFLASLPMGVETPAIRAVFYQWYLEHVQNDTLGEALEKAISGPGGVAQSRRRTEMARTGRVPARKRVTSPPKSTRRSAIPVATVDDNENPTATPKNPPQAASPRSESNNEVPSEVAINLPAVVEQDKQEAPPVASTLKPAWAPFTSTVPEQVHESSPSHMQMPAQAGNMVAAVSNARQAENDNAPVDISKLSTIEFDGLMNLDTMFNIG